MSVNNRSQNKTAANNATPNKMAANVTQNKMAAQSVTQNKMAANSVRQNHAAGSGSTHQLTSSMLLQQIQTLSDLQNSGIVQHADPAAQVSHVT